MSSQGETEDHRSSHLGAAARRRVRHGKKRRMMTRPVCRETHRRCLVRHKASRAPATVRPRPPAPVAPWPATTVEVPLT